MGFERLATGHHARVTGNGSLRLRRGADVDKDQSYVLSMLGQGELARVVFPVGEMTKNDVCFIGSAEGRAGFLSRQLEFHGADVVNGAGDPVGTVDAVELVTVGQRKGMGHGTDGARRYVVAVDVPSRRVTVGSAAEAVTSAIALPSSTLTWVDRPLGDGARAVAQVSAHGRPARCSLARTDDGLMVEFDVPQRPVAAGQTVALYDIVDQDAVVGAGIAA